MFVHKKEKSGHLSSSFEDIPHKKATTLIALFQPVYLFSRHLLEEHCFLSSHPSIPLKIKDYLHTSRAKSASSPIFRSKSNLLWAPPLQTAWFSKPGQQNTFPFNIINLKCTPRRKSAKKKSGLFCLLIINIKILGDTLTKRQRTQKKYAMRLK